MKWYRLGNVYVTSFTGNNVISSVKEDNAEMTKVAAITSLVAGSFFHDFSNQRIYIYPTAGDNPNSSGKTYMFYTWIGFSDSQADFEIQGEDMLPYYPVIQSKDVPPFTMQITELFKGEITFQFGQIKLNYPEWALSNFGNYVFINSDITIKYGENEDTAYADYTSVVWGLIENIMFSEIGLTVTIKDLRDRLYSTIPPNRFLVSDFDYLPTGIHYQTRPVLLGEKTGIQPNLISTIVDTYEITQTSFLFGDFAMQSIDAVYKDGVLLSTPADYSEDLTNGQFTLTASPGSSTITCDAKGLKISRDFSTSTWNNTYSQNIADITFFCLKLQNIEDSYIDETSFETLQSGSTGIECGDLVNQEIDFKEKLKELQTTGKFHLLPTADGQIEVISYRRSDTASVQLTNEYYSELTIKKTSADILNRVLIRYDKNPVYNETETESGETLGDYQYYRRVNDSTGHKYQVVKMENFKTIINNESDAENLSHDFISLYERPTEWIDFKTFHDAIGYQLLEKIGISYSELIEGADTSIYSQEPFILMAKIINWDGYIQLKLRKDPATVAGQPIDDHNFNHIQDHNFNEVTT